MTITANRGRPCYHRNRSFPENSEFLGVSLVRHAPIPWHEERPGPDAGPFTPGVEKRQNPDPFQAGRRKSAGLFVSFDAFVPIAHIPAIGLSFR